MSGKPDVNANEGSAGAGKQRRCSIVIHETQQLLSDLHQDADRSNALMAELESLLKASQAASRSSFGDVARDAFTSANFKAAKPLEAPDDDDQDNDVADVCVDATSRRFKTMLSVRRTSSVAVPVDAGSFFNPPPLGPVNSTSSCFSTASALDNQQHASHRQQPPPLTANARARSWNDASRPGGAFRVTSSTADGATGGPVSELAVIGSRHAGAPSAAAVGRRSLSIDIHSRGALPPSRGSSRSGVDMPSLSCSQVTLFPPPSRSGTSCSSGESSFVVSGSATARNVRAASGPPAAGGGGGESAGGHGSRRGK